MLLACFRQLGHMVSRDQDLVKGLYPLGWRIRVNVFSAQELYDPVEGNGIRARLRALVPALCLLSL